MKTFRIDSSLRRSRDLMELLYTLAMFLALFAGMHFLATKPISSIWYTITAMSLIFSWFLLPYHVEEITVDHETKKIAFSLRSRFTGRKEKLYELGQVQSEVRNNSTLGSINNSGVTLKIHLSRNKTFSINGRHGFNAGTLSAIDEYIKLGH